MLKNTKNLFDDMKSSNLSHAKDLEAAFLELQKSSMNVSGNAIVKFTTDDIHALTTKSNRDFLSKRKVGQRPEKPKRKKPDGSSESSSNQKEPKKPEQPQVHKEPQKWAKALYRSIIVVTHPDKVSGKSDWPELKKEKYVQIGMKAMDSYSAEDYPTLISLGTDIDVYSNQLPAKGQMSILNDAYSGFIKEIDVIQDSLSWRWGSFWTSDEERIKILQLLCVNHGFQPPPKDICRAPAGALQISSR